MFRKLTYATAQKIRQIQLEQPHLSGTDIHKQLNLNCSASAVYAILAGRTYRTFRDGHFNPKQKLNSQLVREIKGQIKLGRRMEWLAVKYEVSMSCIQRIKYGLTWRDTR